MRIRVLLPLVCTAVACARRPVEIAPASLTTLSLGAPVDSLTAVATYDSVWSRVWLTYYDTSFRGIDWRAEREKWRPLAQRARTQEATRQAIDSLLSRLGDSHLGLVSVADDADPLAAVDQAPGVDGAAGYLGLEFRMLDGEVVVSRVVRHGAAARAGVHPGWVVRRLGSLTSASVVAKYTHDSSTAARKRAAVSVPLRLQAATFGAAGSRVDAEFKDATGAVRRLDLTRGPFPGEVVRFGALPPQHFLLEFERLATNEGCVGFVRFTNWMPPLLNQLERAVDSLRACRGVVLDLRGNTGGVAAIVMGLSGFFMDRADSLGELRTRTGTMRYIVNPRRTNRRGETVRPYGGPVAILIDEVSASTSEIFAAGLRDLGRARLFGDSTAGKALPSTLAKLPNGDVLIHPIADFRSPAGQRIEASGVGPDVYRPLRLAELRRGVDGSLAAALDWIAGRRLAGTP